MIAELQLEGVVVPFVCEINWLVFSGSRLHCGDDGWHWSCISLAGASLPQKMNLESVTW